LPTSDPSTISSAVPSVRAPLLEAKCISKHYGRVSALTGADLTIGRDEIVALVGDNGAGKSTLVKILSGAVVPSSGDLRIDGAPVSFSTPADSRAAGIETVYQDLALALHLGMDANLFLGRELTRTGLLGRFGWLDKPAMAARTKHALDALQITVDSVQTPVESLSGGQRQAVAVARAAAWSSTRLLLMDEPTAALGVAQQAEVNQLIQEVRKAGLSVLLVSHNLPQVHELCDRIVVLRQGRVVANLQRSDVSIQDTVMWITGGFEAVP
jgi:simple sugar transport system ATP-binding protein